MPLCALLLFLLWPTSSRSVDLVADNNNNNSVLNIRYGLLLPSIETSPCYLDKVRPAILVAIDKLKYIYPDRYWKWHAFEDKEDDLEGPLRAIDMFSLQKIHVLFGPVHSFILAPSVRYSTVRYKVPILSPGGHASAFGQNQNYMMLTRILATFDDVASCIHVVFTAFGWMPRPYSNVVIFKQPVIEQHRYTFIAESVKLTLQKWKYKMHEVEVKKDDSDYAGMLIETSRYARVVVLCADPDSVRQIMKTAYDLNFINGEYVFFNVDLFSNRTQTLRPWYRANDTDEGNEKARKAYRALLTVTLRKPDSEEYKNFSKKVKDLASERFNFTSYGEEEVNSFVGAFHDAVLLYALALNETLAENQSITDGLYITRKMWNRKFTGITGNISINERGDRNADYSLLDMNKDNGDFEVVANYFGNDQKYEPVKGKKIDWGTDNPGPPPDTPKCGFDESGCPRNQMSAAVISAIVMAGLIAVALVVGLFVYRRMKFQAQLQAMNWIIEWEELTTKRHKPQRPSKKSGTRFFGLERDSSGKRKFSFQLKTKNAHLNQMTSSRSHLTSC